MNQSLFNYENYKSYLADRLGGKSERRGLKSKVALALGCQPTYISQVLHGVADLSLEQADALNSFLGHTSEEAHFFMLMVQRDRAGTVSLKKYFDRAIDEELAKRLNLTKRLGTQNTLTKEDQTRYYSSWHYAAIHIALTIPTLRSVSALSQYFKISNSKTLSVLNFLTEKGLAVLHKDGRYLSGSNFIRLGNESPNIIRHHSNWRLSAISSLDREAPRDLHYSAVVSLSKKDVVKLKNKMLDEIKHMVAEIKDSKEEELYCYTLDFFSLGESS